MHHILHMVTHLATLTAMNKSREWVSWQRGGQDFSPFVKAVAERDWVMLSGDDRDTRSPLPVFLHLARGSDGRVLCDALIVGRLMYEDEGIPGEVTSRSLREIPIAELIETALKAQDLPDEFGDMVRRLVENLDVVGTPKRRPGRSGIGDDEIRAAADLYRAAVATRRKPIEWMAEEMHVSEATVRRRLRRARDKEFLAEAPPGKAGEVQEGDDDGNE